MRLFITGGAGCLGSNLIDYYHNKGVELCSIDNLSTGNIQNIQIKKNFKFYEGSVSDYNLLFEIFNYFKPTHIINCAASYKDPNNWIEDASTNIIGAINLINICKIFPVKKIINLQTALCYGKTNVTPIPVDHKINPETSYGISKTAGEFYFINSELPVVSLRLANICSPRLSVGPLPNFYKNLKNGDKCYCTNSIRDFLDISDFISLIEILLKNDLYEGVYNVSSGKGNSILDVLKLVAFHLKINLTNFEVLPTSPDDVEQIILDSSFTKKKLGWEARVSFEDMIKKQLLWYDENGVDQVFSHLKKK